MSTGSLQEQKVVTTSSEDVAATVVSVFHAPRGSIIELMLKRIRFLEQALVKFAMSELTDLQKTLLKKVRENEGKKTLTALTRELSKRYGIPESTVKWNLRKLRDMGLIIAGNAESKGTPVSLTEIGRLVVRHL